MDQLYLLWFLSISMLIGSFLSGLVPLSFKLSDNKSRLLALLGSGILVGTALAIIIPEGIDALYSRTHPIPVLRVKSSSHLPTASPNDDDQEQQALLTSDRSSKTWTVGSSLIIGFVLMLLIDQFSIYQGSASHHDSSEQVLFDSHANYTLTSQEDDIDISNQDLENKDSEDMDTTSDIKLTRDSDTNRIVIRTNEEYNHTGVSIASNANRYYDHSRHLAQKPRNPKVTPTLGLVIHAFADGIALGAAATTSHRDVEMIIFLAIMLHKAPAAFSLVVLLIHSGLKPTTIRKHLLAFSLSAPIAAILTFYGLGQPGKEALRRGNATGIAMLFSAGTFLFVATVHVLPDLVHNRLLTAREMFFLIGGAFLPLLLAQTV